MITTFRYYQYFFVSNFVEKSYDRRLAMGPYVTASEIFAYKQAFRFFAVAVATAFNETYS